MTCGIYELFDSRTDECLYIGQSKDIEGRFRGHKKILKNGKHRRKDFVEWFSENSEFLEMRVLEVCENDDLIKNQLEIKWFNEKNPRFFGKRPSLKDKWEHSESVRKSISKKVTEFNPPTFLDLECSFCGRYFQRKKHRAERRINNYCSRKCYNSYTSTVKRSISYEEVKELCEQGFTQQEIGNKLGFSNCYISLFMKKHNLKRIKK